jgi:hypothetical protein
MGAGRSGKKRTTKRRMPSTSGRVGRERRKGNEKRREEK